MNSKYSSRYKTYSLQNLNDLDKVDWKKSYVIQPKEIGRGHFSKVYRVSCKSTSSHFAAKVIRRRRNGKDLLEKVRKEAHLMKKLNEAGVQSVLRLYKTYENFSDIVLILELANGGCLYNLVSNSLNGLDQDYTKVIIYKLLEALEALHNEHIVHLDIKADNILLRESYPSTNIALCDFGLAHQLKAGVKHKELVGTPDYMAPEVVNYENVSVNSDMWSVGVLIHYTLSKISPFIGNSKEDTLTNVSKATISFSQHFSNEDYSEVKDLISNLCVKDAGNRLTSQEALLHPWFANVNQNHPNPSHVIETISPFINSQISISSDEDDSKSLQVDLSSSAATRCMSLSFIPSVSDTIMKSQVVDLSCNNSINLTNNNPDIDLNATLTFNQNHADSLLSITELNVSNVNVSNTINRSASLCSNGDQLDGHHESEMLIKTQFNNNIDNCPISSSSECKPKVNGDCSNKHYTNDVVDNNNMIIINQSKDVDLVANGDINSGAQDMDSEKKLTNIDYCDYENISYHDTIRSTEGKTNSSLRMRIERNFDEEKLSDSYLEDETDEDTECEGQGVTWYSRLNLFNICTIL